MKLNIHAIGESKIIKVSIITENYEHKSISHFFSHLLEYVTSTKELEYHHFHHIIERLAYKIRIFKFGKKNLCRIQSHCFHRNSLVADSFDLWMLIINLKIHAIGASKIGNISNYEQHSIWHFLCHLLKHKKHKRARR